MPNKFYFNVFLPFLILQILGMWLWFDCSFAIASKLSLSSIPQFPSKLNLTQYTSVWLEYRTFCNETQSGGGALEVRSGHHFRIDQQEWSSQNNGSDQQLLTVVGSLDQLFFYYNRSGQVLICMSYSKNELLPMSLQATIQTAFDFYHQNKLIYGGQQLFESRRICNVWLFELRQNFYELWTDENLETEDRETDEQSTGNDLCQAVLYTYIDGGYATLVQQSVRLEFDLPVDRHLFAVPPSCQGT